MIKTPKGKEYGKRMKVLSIMYVNKYSKNFFSGQWEEEDIETIFNDAANLAMIGQYLIDGNINAAYSLASDLDTLVRDEIPSSVWNYMEKYQEELANTCLM